MSNHHLNRMLDDVNSINDNSEFRHEQIEDIRHNIHYLKKTRKENRNRNKNCLLISLILYTLFILISAIFYINRYINFIIFIICQFCIIILFIFFYYICK